MKLRRLVSRLVYNVEVWIEQEQSKIADITMRTICKGTNC